MNYLKGKSSLLAAILGATLGLGVVYGCAVDADDGPDVVTTPARSTTVVETPSAPDVNITTPPAGGGTTTTTTG